MEPAKTIIAKCGGHAKAADYAGVDVVTTYRWTYPRDKGGAGGQIPQRNIQRMIQGAQADGISLTLADFYPGVPSKGDAA